MLPISDKFNDYAQTVAQTLKQGGFRVVLDDRNEKIGKKIREAELQRTPYLLILGEREASEQTVSVRARGGVDKGSMPIADFHKLLQQELTESFA